MIHELPLERRTVHGHFSPDLAPVLTVDPGDSVAFRSLNSGWRWEPDGEFLAERDDALDGGHALNGPVEVRGAKAGHTLVVRIDEVVPGGWGVTFGEGTPFVWTIRDGLATDERGTTVALAPFLGVIGMPPPEPGVHSTAPPRRWGGNIDCKLLVAGTTLYLPVPVDGALLSAGDGHGAQGDGEVSGTAIECPLERARLTLDLQGGPELRMPVARTADAWLTFGFDEDLDVAAELATETMLDLLEREHGLGRVHALALASVVVDLRVTQVVNGVKGVHAVLRDGALRG
ncbi:MAG TPA: acetamidase/formamidase family protein [Gaiellaceae bacterium]|nr:acetamidase/formamidase family protein [Gaiellaceae bacterium]